jgi:glycine/D-amino acid oxidase-like deaminating enzyme
VTEIIYSTLPTDEKYPYVLSTPRGPIRASKVVHCTNGFASHLLPGLRAKVFPLRGTMSTQKPGPTFPNHGASRSWAVSYKGSYCAETALLSAGLYYITQDPQTGDINIGGEVQKLGEMLSSDDSVIGTETRDNIASALPKIFRSGWEGTEPEPKRIWSGIMGFTGDRMPLVGKLSAKMTMRAGCGEWAAVGFNGHGMDKCWLTGEALAGMIAGKDVSSWFPESYLVSDERLDSRMSVDGIVDMFTSL